MTNADKFNYAAIPVAILVTVLAFVAAFMGWV